MHSSTRRMGFTGLILAGVLVSGVASADEHQESGGPAPGMPDQMGDDAPDRRVEPDGRPAAQPGVDPHQRSMGEDRMRNQTEEERRNARGSEGNDALPSVGARAGDESSYTVRSGDTLGSISERFLGNGGRWKEIAKANQIEDPNQLKVGTRLKIPQQGDMNRPSGQADPQREDADRQPRMGDDRPGEGSMTDDDESPDRGESIPDRPGAGT